MRAWAFIDRTLHNVGSYLDISAVYVSTFFAYLEAFFFILQVKYVGHNLSIGVYVWGCAFFRVIESLGTRCFNG